MRQKTIQLAICFFLASLPLIISCSKNATTHETTQPENSRPIKIVSVTGPLEPINPGGPRVEIRIENISDKSIISVTATLDLKMLNASPFQYTFNITPSNPLLPEVITNDILTLISGAFDRGAFYPLTIDTTSQDGERFNYTLQVQVSEDTVTPPPLMNLI